MASFQTPIGTRSSTMLETSCGYLLQELQMIWDEVGEDQFDREKVLLDLEQECLEVYRRKVDDANVSRARLHQELAEAEAEFTHLLLSLGERSLPGRPEKMAGTLKEQLDSVTPALREMRLRKEERMKQLSAIQVQIQKISAEIEGKAENVDSSRVVVENKTDLSMTKLEEYQNELQRLHSEKNERLQRVEKYIDTVHKLSATLGMDASTIITKIHPSLDDPFGRSKNISDSILEKLKGTVESLKEEKQQRLEKLHNLGKTLTNLWELMDSPYSDRRLFSHVIRLLSFSSPEISDPGSLALYIIEQAEAEVKRLDQLKASKMKELFIKKQMELEDICNKSHMVIPSRSGMEKIINLIHSGEIDHANLLTSMDEQISRAKEEASSRKTIMEKVEKWMLTCDEERWLEEYNMDQSRYSVSRGAHKNLRRAERARIAVNKIPALVELLLEKTRSWEAERSKVFLYDEVPLLELLEEYNALRQEKEEKRRPREKKKVQTHILIEPESFYGPRPSTSSRRLSNASINGGYSNAIALNRRLSQGILQFGSNNINSATQGISFIKEAKKSPGQNIARRHNLDSRVRDETASVVSTFSGPISP
ncbi:65-kDa microtubule-associated protein 8-like isoform X1 [Cucurbita moschata]|uniref:65-kDa microtubule-associated protein 8-like isoform X1 n=1 Tax=Cucurbita moschata TaxID=3662 RepID=A0A6J1HF78_CUCMO|nr:65-kDa microtubule-associated protein 8-like isoform X1 [Cucurbita moschata]